MMRVIGCDIDAEYDGILSTRLACKKAFGMTMSMREEVG